MLEKNLSFPIEYKISRLKSSLKPAQVNKNHSSYKNMN